MSLSMTRDRSLSCCLALCTIIFFCFCSLFCCSTSSAFAWMPTTTRTTQRPLSASLLVQWQTTRITSTSTSGTAAVFVSRGCLEASSISSRSVTSRINAHRGRSRPTRITTKTTKTRQWMSSSEVNFDDFMEMDVVVYSDSNVSSTTQRKLGAVQEDGRVTPLCVWTTEYAFETSLEFLVDEEDLFPGYTSFRTASSSSDDTTTTSNAAGDGKEIIIHSLVPQDALSYGSRQVGGGMGPGNPHGEESECLYYIDQSVLDRENIEIIVKPELEIFW